MHETISKPAGRSHRPSAPLADLTGNRDRLVFSVCRGLLLLAVLLILAAPLSSQAQWVTQTIDLKAGWNAVFLHVDATHATLDDLVGNDLSNPIQEVWLWSTPFAAQFSSSPSEPDVTAEWTSWGRTNSASILQRLVGDSAYLVRVSANVATYTWSLKGKPVAPRHDWTISGLNLIGFSTMPNTPPNFKDFLAQAAEFQSTLPEIYYYTGGELSSNPVKISSPFQQQLTDVVRGQAFWVRAGAAFNRYFGPFEVVQAGTEGVRFGDASNSSRFRLRNLTSSELTVTLRLKRSESPPLGQQPIAGVPPLLLRGNVLNLTNLTYTATNLVVDSPQTWVLAPRDMPGSDAVVVLGLNRAAITNAPGVLLGGILRFTDSLGYSQVDVPLSATAASSAGLWVGEAMIDRVGQYLVSYLREDQTNYVEAANGDLSIGSIATDQLVQDTNGAYVVTGVNTSLAAVPQAFSGRLIIQNPTNGTAVLLQRVYHGFSPDTNVVVATGESALDPTRLQEARRISSTFLPWTADNTPWALNGRLGAQANFGVTVSQGYGAQESNPFLHTYHPDHDNRDAQFNLLAGGANQGVESYTIERSITLQVTPPTDFSSIVSASQTLTGVYAETISLKGLNTSSRDYHVSGVFELHRISQVSTLTIAP